MSTRSSSGSSGPSEPVPRARAFAPVAGPGTRVLVLGSLPGAASLAAGQYYAHPRNGFWRLIGAVIGRELGPLGYSERLAALEAAGIGLWDTVASAVRPGSLDGAIRGIEPAELGQLASRLPELRAIGFNGAKAAAVGRRQAGLPQVALIDLPSSSPALTLPWTDKLARWSVLRDHLR
ncbi:MAG: DNA-deoxyinosine glycosylase [Amaricoccus sp.]